MVVTAGSEVFRTVMDDLKTKWTGTGVMVNRRLESLQSNDGSSGGVEG